MTSINKVFSICLLLILSFSIKAQDATMLKSYINKNDIAVRSVQKHAIKLNDPTSSSELKEILLLQMSSVTAFNNNNTTISKDLAVSVRNKCSEFLTKNSKTSIEYLQLSEKEKKFFTFNTSAKSDSFEFNSADVNKVEALNLKDPHIFDNLSTHID